MTSLDVSSSSSSLCDSILGSSASTSSLSIPPVVSILPSSLDSHMDVNDARSILSHAAIPSFPGFPIPSDISDSSLGESSSRPRDRIAPSPPSDNGGVIEDMISGVQMGIKVRGLDLMRYGRLENGVYKCIECERIHIPKTFKTSYSFQRHAYLYHEGSPKRFPCPACGKEFSRPDKRKSHLKEKHGLFQTENVDTNFDLNEAL